MSAMGANQHTKSKVSKGQRASQTAEVRKAREIFKRGVLTRGEAAKRLKGGKLPPGVTHEFVNGDIVRRRFSAV